MKRAAVCLLLGLVLLELGRGQTPSKTALVVEFEHKTFYAQPGVTAAYSLDPAIAQASAVAGGFQVAGTGTGQTNVVVVDGRGAHTVLVTVIAGTDSRRAPAALEGPSASSSYGQYLVSYSNNPNQVTNVTDLTQISGDRQIHIQVTNANIFPAQGESPVGFPVLSYEVSRPRRSFTLLDKMVDNSDLTMEGVLLRGFHAEVGDWELHGGITSVTQFQDFLLQGNRFEVGGVSRRFKLSGNTALKANVYYFATDSTVNLGATTGAIGTLQYRYDSSGLKVKAEVGAGNGYALAGSIDRHSERQELHADYRYESPNIATLGINQMHGRVADLNWTMRLGKRLTLQAFGSDTSIHLPTEQQRIGTLNLNQAFWITPHVSILGGAIVSTFQSQAPAYLSVQSQGWTAGPQIMWKHFGASYQRQSLVNSGTTPESTNQAFNVQASAGQVSVSAYYNQQTETPVFAPVQSANPSLQDLLRHTSEQALGAQQMGDYLRQHSALLSRGLVQPAAFGVAARRSQFGGSANWSTRRAGRLSVTGLVNDSSGSGPVPALRLLSGGITWTRQLGATNLVNTGVSFFRTESQGKSTTEPVVQVSLEHQLYAFPHFLAPGRRGTIDGHVFVDAKYAQAFQDGDTPLPGVLVRLDKHRTTRTGRDGHYFFKGVPYGAHTVEIEYRDAHPFFYTSSSPRSIASGETADFGISFARGRLFGQVKNDAGSALPVTVTVAGGGITRNFETDADGQFRLEGLPDGDYRVHIVDVSLPAGYFAGDLEDHTVTVSAEHAGRLSIVIPAQRSISGKVEAYDPVEGRTVPLQHARVTIAQAGKISTTDALGRYLFRQLPPGEWTITCDYHGREYSRTVSLAPSPDIQNGINFTIPLTDLARSNGEQSPSTTATHAGREQNQ